ATEEWAFTTDQVVSIPVVADLDGDGSPEVVVNTTHIDGGSWPEGEIVVLSGMTGAELWRIDHDPAAGSYGSHGRHSIGVGDVSGDGLPDIIYAGRQGAGGSVVHAVDGQGTLLWSSHTAAGAEHRLDIVNGGASLANLDDDPEAEIVFGAAVIDDDGTVVWDEAGDGAGFGTNGGYRGGITAIVDLQGDATPELVSGRHAWTVDWQEVGGVPQVTVAPLWDAGGADGYPAIADLDQDGTPEVIVVASGQVRVLDGETGLAWCGIDPTDAMCVADPSARTAAVAIPGGGIGGPPTVADFDGDGRPEIAAAGGSSYSVYDLARPGEDISVPVGAPVPEPGSVFVRWSQPTQDQSSNATGSSVFDFQGDGVAEVVYADECFMRVYSGVDGAVLFELPNSTGTIHEYPLVVDVDDDGNSEILVVANDGHSACDALPGYVYTRGVRSFGDTFDQWVQTRRVWTQHTYHVTNTNSVGHVPAVEIDNWTQPDLNNYRQNVQGEGVFNAPDLTVELVVGLGSCFEQQLELLATVRNVGSLGVPAGIDVTLYEGTDATGTAVGTQATPQPLLPGAQIIMSWTVPFPPGSPALSYFVAVDGAEAAQGDVIECDESNNSANTVTAECPAPG
ncbi:MAG: FG-GAP-like repeat-containing protein, partial [Nannocystaceae bacterium]